MTPDEMKALTEQARRIKRALDGEQLDRIYGGCWEREHAKDRTAFARNCIALLTGPARLEWAKVVRRSVDLYGLGINSEKQFNTGDNERGCKSVQYAESIERDVNSLAAILTAGLEGTA